MKYQAVIFDLDGVICSTDQYHYQAWKAVADELNIPFDETVTDCAASAGWRALKLSWKNTTQR